MSKPPSELQPLTPKPQVEFSCVEINANDIYPPDVDVDSYEYIQGKCWQLEHENEQLRQAYIENDKKWQADYDNLLVKYELTNERILEK